MTRKIFLLVSLSSLNRFILQMISTNRNTSNGEEGEEIELELLNPPAPTETANIATGSDEEANGVVDDDVVGARGGSEDIVRGDAGTENVETVSSRRDGVRC